MRFFAFAALACVAAAAAIHGPPTEREAGYQTTCAAIAAAISSASEVFYAPSLQYDADISHPSLNAAQTSACSVEPGTTADVSIIIKILGQTETPFAVKGGGHTANAGFSSTPGVQIAMSRFSEITYDASSSTATLGAGLVWDDVYASLPPQGVNVVGGRVSGVGVAGFTLGGGYSYLSNQHGLTIDNMVSYTLVLPNGTIVDVSASTYPDLFWALRGAGQVNFGIVTDFTMKTYTQTEVYGGFIAYAGTEFDAIAEATYTWVSENNDPKAAILPTFSSALDLPLVVVLLFYDAPTPPSGTFDVFTDVPYLWSELSTQSYADLVRAVPDNITSYSRAAFNTVPLTALTPSLLAQVVNQTLFWGSTQGLEGSFYLSIDVEPFLSNAFAQSQGGAYPHSTPLLPQCFYWTWESELDDEFWLNAIQESANVLTQQAIGEGQPLTNAVLYNNYALANTPLQKLYGPNVAELQSIYEQYDPTGVMQLTGGFKL